MEEAFGSKVVTSVSVPWEEDDWSVWEAAQTEQQNITSLLQMITIALLRRCS